MAENIEKDQNSEENNEEQQVSESGQDKNENVEVAANLADFDDLEESNIRDKGSSEKLDFLKDLM